jgi:hypothetical protein
VQGTCISVFYKWTEPGAVYMHWIFFYRHTALVVVYMRWMLIYKRTAPGAVDMH